MKSLYVLPDNLPIPIDDGACVHLEGMQLPSVSLLNTIDQKVNISTISGIAVFYCYPMIGRPDALPMIGWNEIPGARGCTPQSCSFRDHYSELHELGAEVFGVSSQPLEEQKEAAQRLNLPFELLNDASFQLANALKLPTFEYNSSRLIKRLTLIVENGTIRKVFYPIFPPNENAKDVIAWLQTNKN